jgi:hypothetical protein
MSSHTQHHPTTAESEDDAVLSWRFDQLCLLGFEDVEAVFLAYSELDLHLLRRLVAAGCPHQLAVKIAL